MFWALQLRRFYLGEQDYPNNEKKGKGQRAVSHASCCVLDEAIRECSKGN